MTVDPSAILRGRPPGRAPTGVIVAIAFSSVCLMIVLAFDAIDGGASFVVGLLLALLPLGIWLPVILALDRMEPEPKNALILAFLWGAGVAALVSMVLNTLHFVVITDLLVSADDGWYWTAVVGAPIVEEVLKAFVLFGMLWFRRHEINGLTDGIIYASMVGLGFAATENITYFIEAAEEEQLGFVFLMRAVIAPLLHPLCTAMTGIGVAVAAMSRPGTLRFAAPLIGLTGAIALHSLWNAASSRGIGGLASAYLIGLVVMIVLVVVVQRERRRLVGLILHYLPKYIPTGVVAMVDVQMLSSLKARKAAREWATSRGGRASGTAMREYQQAATELAMLHERAEHAAAEPVELESQRQALLWVMQRARATFLPSASTANLPWANNTV
ncbi:PrsW family glutamic-type intramembrane protease [Myceligenerans halotolerans]